MNLKIGLIEPESHNEVLRAYLIACLPFSKTINCFTNKFNFNQIYDLKHYSKINWFVKPDDSDFSKWLKGQTKELNLCDVIVCCTDSDKLYDIDKLPGKSILVIHDFNATFYPSINLYSDTNLEQKFKDKVKWLLYNIKSKASRKLDFISKFDHISFPSSHIIEYASKFDFSNKSKMVDSLPFAINDEFSKRHDRNEIIIGVPGTIGYKSRNYQELIDAMPVIRENVKRKVHFVLLGRPIGNYGQKIIEELGAFSTVKLKFSFFEDFIEQNEFDKWMRSMDFLVLPIARHMKFDIFQEKNGYTCVSGNINDMIRYGIPSIIPSFYPLSDKLNDFVERYDDGMSMAKHINNWVNTRSFDAIKENGMAQLSSFNKTSISQDFYGVFSKVLNQTSATTD